MSYQYGAVESGSFPEERTGRFKVRKSYMQKTFSSTAVRTSTIFLTVGMLAASILYMNGFDFSTGSSMTNFLDPHQIKPTSVIAGGTGTATTTTAASTTTATTATTTTATSVVETTSVSSTATTTGETSGSSSATTSTAATNTNGKAGSGTQQGNKTPATSSTTEASTETEVETETETETSSTSTYESPIQVMESSKGTKPNIIFMLADDMGWGSISSDVSPFMYKMSKKGVTLTNYYSQEACTPARASLLTGRYPLSLGLQYYEHSVDETGGLGLDETTFAEVMQSAGYMTYMLGKWNLGNESPRYLPTARGFDYFLGYMDGFTNYWSKTSPDNAEFKDFTFADTECYYEYDGEDLNVYSTTLYQDRAIDIIRAHDYTAYPMFMYLAFQAVHDPFSETAYPDGIPNDLLDKSIRKYIEKNYDGHMQQQYLKSLSILDAAVENIYYALDDQGVLDNTYIIFASDNGGCPSGGGRNYPFRGTKGSFFEGGVHVESFMYSPTFLKGVSGNTYDGLFHVSDWFPTMLDMAGLFYVAPFGKELDGVSHYNALVHGDDSPRDYLLINYYFDPYRSQETLWTGKAVAIRDKQYKLLHAYTSLGSSAWYQEKEVYEDYDDELDRHTGCGQVNAVNNGDFTYFLFDLENDPSETENLYDKNSKMQKIQKALYAKLDEYTARAANTVAGVPSPDCIGKWKRESGYIVPWASAEGEEEGLTKAVALKPFPKSCGLYSQATFEYRKKR